MNNMCPGLNMQYSVDSGVTWLDYSPGVTMDTATGVLARTRYVQPVLSRITQVNQRKYVYL